MSGLKINPDVTVNSSDDDNTLILVIIIIIVIIAIVGIIIYANYSDAPKALSEIKHDACKAKIDMYKILGIGTPKCAKNKCPLHLQPLPPISPAGPRCHTTGMEIYTNADNQQCCKYPADMDEKDKEPEKNLLMDGKYGINRWVGGSSEGKHGKVGPIDVGDMMDTMRAVLVVEFVKHVMVFGMINHIVDYGVPSTIMRDLYRGIKKVATKNALKGAGKLSEGAEKILEDPKLFEIGGDAKKAKGAVDVTEGVRDIRRGKYYYKIAGKQLGLKEGKILTKKMAEKYGIEFSEKTGLKIGAKLIAKVAEKQADKTLVKLGAKIAVKFAIGESMVGEVCAVALTAGAATCAESAGLGCAAGGAVCAAAQVVDVLVTVASVLGDITDVTGQRQYVDNEKTAKPMRDKIEGTAALRAIVDGDKIKDENYRPPPHLFPLSMLQNLPNIALFPHLKEIGDAFTEAHTAFHGPEAISKAVTQKFLDMDPNTLSKLYYKMEDDDADFFEEFTEAITELIDQDYKARDDFIWKYVTEHYPSLGISGNQGKYIIYVPEISGFNGDTHNYGISLNKAGVEKYNGALTATHKKADAIFPLIFSRYYRGIVKKTDGTTPKVGDTITAGDSKLESYKVIQKALPVEFAQISMSYNMIKTLCENGFDQDKLHSLYPIDKLATTNGVDFNPFSYARPHIVPKDHYVGYDENTGLCKYDTGNVAWGADGYCTYMAYEDDPEMKTMECEGDGCKNSQYPVCHKFGSDNVVGEVLNEAIDLIGLKSAGIIASRVTGDVEKWVDHDKTMHDIGHFFTDTLWHPSKWF